MGKTVRTMRQLIDQGGRDPRVIALTRKALLPIPERNERAEVKHLLKYVQSRVRFVNDPVNAETLMEPGTMADEITVQGLTSEDCDGHVVLLGSMLEAAGYPAEIAVESYRRDGQPSHVALNARLGTTKIHLDPTVKDRPMGSYAGRPRRQYSEGGFAMLGRAPTLGRIAPRMNAQTAAAETQPSGGGGAGVTEELTGKNESDAWGDVIGGITELGSWAMQTPFVENFVLKQRLDIASKAGSLSQKHGIDYISALGLDEPQVQRGAVAAAAEPGMPTWGWVAIGGAAFLALAALMMKRR